MRFALAGILLMAAALKGYQLATAPVAETGLLDSRWFLIGVVEFELFFGLWLLSGLFPRQTWAAAILCFGGFACVSLYKALSGEASCGCFGRVQVNPWLTFTLDVAAVAALFRWRPPLLPSPGTDRRLVGRGAGGEGEAALRASMGRRSGSEDSIASVAPTSREVASEDRRPALRLAAVLILWLLAGVPTGVAMGSYKSTSFSDAGRIVGDGKIVVLEPEKWVGKRFPLLDYIDIGDRLSAGKWLVVLYHPDCPKCQKVIEDLPQRARGLGIQSAGLIAMPPHGIARGALACAGITLVCGRLNGTREWFAETPVVLILDAGLVIKSGKT